MELLEYQKLYRDSLNEPEEFWSKQAKKLDWIQPWHTVKTGTGGETRWFEGGKLSASVQCLDRHVAAGRGDSTALIWESEDGSETRSYTYAQLLKEVEAVAQMLRASGVEKGDRVALYLPLTPELLIAMHACARLGVVHVVIFAGFSAQALATRMEQVQAKVLVTSTYSVRRGKKIPLLETARDARLTYTPELTFVWSRADHPLLSDEKDWEEEKKKYLDQPLHPVSLESEDLFFLLHTSGTTGKPKAIMHSVAGYMLAAQLTCEYVLQLNTESRYWCTADPGWITGHTYIAYGPLSVGATVFLSEGAPDFPQPDRWWSLIAKHKITHFYTAPTAIRLFRQLGPEHPARHDLTSLQLLGTVGEPINPEAWQWYAHHIGGDRCPVIDTWWQTETGSHALATLPGLNQKPGKAGLPFFGIEPQILDEQGRVAPLNTRGNLVIAQPWPSQLRGCWQDETRFAEYWSRFPNKYACGDLATQDSDGYIQIIGRSDDVINIAGHRLGTAEVESALLTHQAVAESAAVAVPDPLLGETLKLFVVLKKEHHASQELEASLSQHLQNTIGRFLKLSNFMFLPQLPKTRSGKIMRRILRAQALGQDAGDMSTLES